MSKLVIITLLNGVYQDGPDFYDDRQIPPLIDSYPELVTGVGDTAGAIAARRQFAKEYPHHVHIEEIT